jgi:hypothetical protein
VYLDEDDKRRLHDVASRTGRSEADLIRRGVRLVVDAERPRPRLPYGASHDGRSAAETDELLGETGFGR